MQSVENKRKELRFEIKGSVPDMESDGLKEIVYDYPWVTTIYFGGKESGFPHGQAIKARFFTKDPQSAPYILQADTPCIFELKIGPKDLTESSRRRKYRINTTLGEILPALERKENFDQLSTYQLRESKKPFPVSLLYAISQHEKTDNFVPIAATHYHRRHFEDASLRATVDTNLQFFKFIKFYKDWFAFPISQPEDGVIVEWKIPLDEEYVHNTSLDSFKSQNLLPSTSKFNKLKGVVEESVLTVVNPEMRGSAEASDWNLMERELKIDLQADARNTLRRMVLDDAEYSLSQSYEETSYQQFLIMGEGSICLMGRGGRGQFEVIKVKTSSHQEGDVLVRKEQIFKYSDEKLRQVFGAGDVEKQRYSAHFIRRRMQRNILCPNSGNIFNVFVDNCVAESPIADLNQCEVEYHGRICAGEDNTFDLDQIDKDFKNLQRALVTYFTGREVPIQSLGTTKYNWIRGLI